VAHAFAPALAVAASLDRDPNTGPADIANSSRSMLFLSSVAGQIGSQTDPPYSAAKAAVINFAQCAAKDLAPFGVRVTRSVRAWSRPRSTRRLRGLGQGAAGIRSPNLRGMDR